MGGEVREDGFGGGRVVAETGEPFDGGLAAKPGDLALGVTAGGLLDGADGGIEIDDAGEMGAELAVTDEVEGLEAGTEAASEQGADFVQPARGKHGAGTALDAGVEGGARRHEADFEGQKTFEARTREAEEFAHGAAGGEANFDGADDLGGVAGRDAGGGGGIEAGEETMEIFGAAGARAAAQAFAELLGAGGSVRQAFEKGAEIEAGAGGDDGQALAGTKILEDFEGEAAVIAGGEDLVRLEEVHEVVRDGGLLGRANLGGADIEVAVDLGGIAAEDFSVPAASDFNGEGGFAGGGGAEDDDEGGGRAHSKRRA